MNSSGLLNAFSVDVEEYFHASALSGAIRKEDWLNVPSSVEPSTHRILELLDESRQFGTFFVLGWVAERFPRLVREIHGLGHEIACHGYSHDLVYDLSEQRFRRETLRSKSLLEDLTGDPVFGYRAASFSITEKTPWAHDILQSLGFTYDSSVFPILHDRYGDRHAPRFPYEISMKNGGELIEFPLSTWNFAGMRIPVSGGGYFRLFPPVIIQAGLRSINVREEKPFIFYIHPWELDPDQPRFNIGLFSRFRHYTNLSGCADRLRKLLDEYKFGTCSNVLSQMGFQPGTPASEQMEETAVG